MASNGFKTFVFEKIPGPSLHVGNYASCGPISGICLEVITYPLAEGQGTGTALINTASSAEANSKRPALVSMDLSHSGFLWVKDVASDSELFKKVMEISTTKATDEPLPQMPLEADPDSKPAVNPKKIENIKKLLQELSPEEMKALTNK